MSVKKARKRWDFLLILKILLALSLGVLSVNYIDSRIRPTVMTTLITHSRAIVLGELNSAVSMAISEMPIDFNSVVTVFKNESGQVTSIETDSLTLNLFQIKVSEKLNSAVLSLKMREQKIPVGSLSGLIFLNGKGFGVPFRLSPLGMVNTEIKSEFTSAGVNQTRHRIVLRVATNVSAIIPTYSVNSEVVAEYTMAETIIVGVTPDFFLQKY